jgi:hypothetical protein
VPEIPKGWEGMKTTSRRGLTTLKKLRDENGSSPKGAHEEKPCNRRYTNVIMYT